MKAVVRYVRVSPRKAKLVADLVRRKRVEKALQILSFTPKKSARIIAKLLKQAVANASQNKGVDVDTLWIKSILVNQGPTLKRFRARARGRANTIRKRTSHISVVLTEG